MKPVQDVGRFRLGIHSRQIRTKINLRNIIVVQNSTSQMVGFLTTDPKLNQKIFKIKFCRTVFESSCVDKMRQL